MPDWINRREWALANLAPLAAPLVEPLRAAGGGKIRVGCQTRAYGSPLPNREKLLDALDGLAAAGYEGFETNFRSLEAAFDDPAPVRAEIARRGIEMIGLHVGVGLFEPDQIPEERALLERVIDGTRALGGSHLIVSGRQLPTDPAGRPLPAALSRKAAELDRIGAWARGRGIRVSFHNHTHEVQHDAAEIRAILAATDPRNVSLLFDVGHVHNDEVSIPDFIAELGPRIAGLHVRDVKDGDEVLIGSGKVDFAALGRALKQSVWGGWVIVEVNRRDDISSADLVRRARKLLRDQMKV